MFFWNLKRFKTVFYLKTRWESGLCFGILNEDRAEDGIGFVERNAAAAARPAPERINDLAADIWKFRFWKKRRTLGLV